MIQTTEQSEQRRVHGHHEVIELYDAVGGQTVNTTSATVIVRTERLNTDARYFTPTVGGEITSHRSGLARIRGRVAVGTTGLDEYQVSAWLEVDGVEIPGTRGFDGAQDDPGTSKVRTITASQTLTNKDRTVLVDAAAGDVTVTLPPAFGNKDRLYKIKRIDTSANTVTITSPDNIDRETIRLLGAPLEALDVISDDTEYWIQ